MSISGVASVSFMYVDIEILKAYQVFIFILPESHFRIFIYIGYYSGLVYHKYIVNNSPIVYY